MRAPCPPSSPCSDARPPVGGAACGRCQPSGWPWCRACARTNSQQAAALRAPTCHPPAPPGCFPADPCAWPAFTAGRIWPLRDQTGLLRVRAFALIPASRGLLRSPAHPFRLRRPGAGPSLPQPPRFPQAPQALALDPVSHKKSLVENRARPPPFGIFCVSPVGGKGACGFVENAHWPLAAGSPWPSVF